MKTNLLKATLLGLTTITTPITFITLSSCGDKNIKVRGIKSLTIEPKQTTGSSTNLYLQFDFTFERDVKTISPDGKINLNTVLVNIPYEYKISKTEGLIQNFQELVAKQFVVTMIDDSKLNFYVNMMANFSFYKYDSDGNYLYQISSVEKFTITVEQQKSI